MTRQNIQHLTENGPSTIDELPGCEVTTEDRMKGVWGFGTSITNGDAGGSAIKTVYYLNPGAHTDFDESAAHSKEEVIRAFLDKNSNLVEAKDRQGLALILGRHGDQWKEAINRVLDDVKPRAAASSAPLA